MSSLAGTRTGDVSPSRALSGTEFSSAIADLGQPQTAFYLDVDSSTGRRKGPDALSNPGNVGLAGHVLSTEFGMGKYVEIFDNKKTPNIAGDVQTWLGISSSIAIPPESLPTSADKQPDSRGIQAAFQTLHS